jgi:hypothetical protein
LVPAKLYEGLCAQNLEDYEYRWRPILLREKSRANSGLEPHAEGPEDAHWDWRRKLTASHKKPLVYREYAVERDGETQGLMQISLGIHYSRLERGQPLVYVEYLQTAPWNRAPVPGRKRYRLVGSILLMQAIGVSDEEDYKGRIGLHSLPKAEAFYSRVPMVALGKDPSHQHLMYFELDRIAAGGILAKMKKGGCDV